MNDAEPKLETLNMDRVKQSRSRFNDTFNQQHQQESQPKSEQVDSDKPYIYYVKDWIVDRTAELKKDKQSVIGFAFIAKRKTGKLPNYQMVMYPDKITMMVPKHNTSLTVTIDLNTFSYKANGYELTADMKESLDRVIFTRTRSSHLK